MSDISNPVQEEPLAGKDCTQIRTNGRSTSRIADLCGIEKQLPFHIARHTFATTVTLLHGVPFESVSKMLGHTNIRTTQHYARIVDKKVGDDMAILAAKIGTRLSISA